MNWIQENKQVALILGISLIIVLACLIGGFSLSSGANSAKEEYEMTLSEVKTLENKETNPDPQSVRALGEKVTLFADSTDKLKQRMNQFGAPIGDIEPEQLRQDIVEAVQQLRNLGAEKRPSVRFNDLFFMGFETYRDQIPPESAKNELAFQFQGVKWLFDVILDSGVTQVISVNRARLPNETGYTPPIQPNNNFGATPPPPPPAFDTMPIEIVLTGTKDSWMKILNAIAAENADYFFTVRGIKIQNQKRESPSRDDVTFGSDQDQEDTPAGGFGGFDFGVDETPDPDAEDQSDINLPGEAKGEEIVKPVLGEEKITYVLHLELLRFKSDLPIPGLAVAN